MERLPEWIEITSEHINAAKQRTLLHYKDLEHYTDDDVRMYDVVLQVFERELLALIELDYGTRFDAKADQDALCARCGHTYRRHFDWMEDHRPGCKYCNCGTFKS